MSAAPSTHDDIGRQRWLVILPATFVMYTISYFDRANMGMALPHIAKELGLTPIQAGWVGAAFAWGYAVTQIAGGAIALRFDPRRLIGVALLLFGGAALACGFARTFGELVALRVLLGLAEGPIYAPVSLFLSQWFTKPERGRAFGIWNLAIPTGAFLAGPISGAILSRYDWRVMMVAEGLPAWIFCAVWLAAIPRSIDAAAWLPDADRGKLKEALGAEQAAHHRPAVDPWWNVLTEPTVWLLTAGFALSGVLMYGTTLWLPTILRSYGRLGEFAIGVYSGLPFVAAMVGIYYIARRSDLNGQERRWHAAVPTMLTGAVMIAAAFVPVQLFYLQIALFVLLGFTLKMLNPLIFSWLTEVLPTRRSIPAVAVVSGVGNLIGQVAGPLIVGYVKSVSNDFFPSLLALGCCAILGGIAIALAGAGSRKEAIIAAEHPSSA